MNNTMMDCRKEQKKCDTREPSQIEVNEVIAAMPTVLLAIVLDYTGRVPRIDNVRVKAERLVIPSATIKSQWCYPYQMTILRDGTLVVFFFSYRGIERRCSFIQKLNWSDPTVVNLHHDVSGLLLDSSRQSSAVMLSQDWRKARRVSADDRDATTATSDCTFLSFDAPPLVRIGSSTPCCPTASAWSDDEQRWFILSSNGKIFVMDQGFRFTRHYSLEPPPRTRVSYFHTSIACIPSAQIAVGEAFTSSVIVYDMYGVHMRTISLSDNFVRSPYPSTLMLFACALQPIRKRGTTSIFDGTQHAHGANARADNCLC